MHISVENELIVEVIDYSVLSCFY